MIKFDRVTKKFTNETVAIEEVDLIIDKGEFVFITGPSGAGKTTLLRMLLRELLPTKGKILLKGEDITDLKGGKLSGLRRRIGAVFQDFKLLDDRTVFENIALSLEIAGKNKEEIEKKVKEVLKLVDLPKKSDLFPRQLAGGELQRVALARSLVSGPEVLFADEPTGNLDPKTSWQIINLMQEINKQGVTLIVATHNFEIVDSLEQRVICLEKGRVVSDKKKGKYKK